jgi:hypothetical protein
MRPLGPQDRAPDQSVAGARLVPPPPAAIGPGAGPATMRLLPVAGDALLDPFEARNTDLSLRLTVRVETDTAGLAPALRAEDILVWVGTREPTASSAGGYCMFDVDIVLNASTGDGGSEPVPAPKVGGKRNILYLRNFQPARSGVGGVAGFELSVNISLNRSADGW